MGLEGGMPAGNRPVGGMPGGALPGMPAGGIALLGGAEREDGGALCEGAPICAFGGIPWEHRPYSLSTTLLA
eukprot:3307600-Pyramimonas_sp.AAC.2